MRRRGKRRKQLLYDLEEKRGYWKLKEEALGRTRRGTGFERGCGHIARQTKRPMTYAFPQWHINNDGFCGVFLGGLEANALLLWKIQICVF